MNLSTPQQNETALHAVDYWQVIKNRYGIILLTLLLVFMTAAVITVGELARELDRSKGAGRLHDSMRDPSHFVDLDFCFGHQSVVTYTHEGGCVA